MRILLGRVDSGLARLRLSGGIQPTSYGEAAPKRAGTQREGGGLGTRIIGTRAALH
jgi:hypothetical protein